MNESEKLVIKKEDISKISDRIVKCRYCHQDVKLLVLPIHENYCKELGVEDSVIFTGKVKWDDMPCYYHVATVFASASKTETQGLTIIEAMASNVVPVCMRDEAFQSMVTEDLNGLFFETEDLLNKHVSFLNMKSDYRK